METPEVEIYLHAWLALASAQVLERAVINSLVYTEIIPEQRERPIPSDEWEKKYDVYVGEKYEKTLGLLINALKKLTPVPPELERTLKDALEKRNFLVHRFFRVHSDAVIGLAKNENALQQLSEAQRVFQSAEKMLREFMRPAHERYAVTEPLRKYLESGYLEGFAK